MHKKNVSGILTNLEGALIQEWLQQHGPFDAVVDGANVGLVNQRDFNFFQVTGLLITSLSRVILLVLSWNHAASVLTYFFWL